LKVCSALYLFDDVDERGARERFTLWLQGAAENDLLAALPIYTREELPLLIARISEIHAPLVA
jgi:hypothetical protein